MTTGALALPGYTQIGSRQSLPASPPYFFFCGHLRDLNRRASLTQILLWGKKYFHQRSLQTSAVEKNHVPNILRSYLPRVDYPKATGQSAR